MCFFKRLSIVFCMIVLLNSSTNLNVFQLQRTYAESYEDNDRMYTVNNQSGDVVWKEVDGHKIQTTEVLPFNSQYKILNAIIDSNNQQWYEISENKWINVPNSLKMASILQPEKAPNQDDLIRQIESKLIYGDSLMAPNDFYWTIPANESLQKVWDYYRSGPGVYDDKEIIDSVKAGTKYKILEIGKDVYGNVMYKIAPGKWIYKEKGTTYSSATNRITKLQVPIRYTTTSEQTIVWTSYKTIGEKTGRIIPKNQQFIVNYATMDSKNNIWYEIGKHEWILVDSYNMELYKMSKGSISKAPNDFKIIIGNNKELTEEWDYFQPNERDIVGQVPSGSIQKVSRIARDNEGNIWYEIGLHRWVKNMIFLDIYIPDPLNKTFQSLENSYFKKPSQIKSIQVWDSYKSFKQKVNKTITTDTVKVIGYAVDKSGLTWYQIGNDLWIPELINPDGTPFVMPNIKPGGYEVVHAPIYKMIAISDGSEVWDYFNSSDMATINRLPIGSVEKIIGIGKDSEGLPWYNIGQNQWLSTGLEFKIGAVGLPVAKDAVPGLKYTVKKGDLVSSWTSFKSFKILTGKKYGPGTVLKVQKMAIDANQQNWYMINPNEWIQIGSQPTFDLDRIKNSEIIDAPKGFTFTTTIDNKNVWDYFNSSDMEVVAHLRKNQTVQVTKAARDKDGILWYSIGKNKWVMKSDDLFDWEGMHIRPSIIKAPDNFMYTVPYTGKDFTWDYFKSNRIKTTILLQPGSKHKVFNVGTDSSGLEWYEIENNLWVPSLKEPNGEPKNLISIKANQEITAPKGFTHTIPSDRALQMVWDHYNSKQREEVRTLPAGTVISVKKIAKDKDSDIWYQIGTNEWVKYSSFMDFTNITAIFNRKTTLEKNTFFKIENQPNGSPIWTSYKDFKEKTGKIINNNTDVNIKYSATDENGLVWYEINNNEWIASNPNLVDKGSQVSNMKNGQVINAPQNFIYYFEGPEKKNTVWTSYDSKSQKYVKDIAVSSHFVVKHIAKDAEGDLWYEINSNEWISPRGKANLNHIFDINFSIPDMQTAVNSITSGLAQLNNFTTDAIGIINTANSAMNKMNQTLPQINKSVSEMNDSLKIANAGIIEMNSGLDTTIKSVDTMNHGIGIMNQTIPDMINAVNTANTGVNQALSGVNQANASVNNILAGLKELNGSLDATHWNFGPMKDLSITPNSSPNIAVSQFKRENKNIKPLPNKGNLWKLLGDASLIIDGALITVTGVVGTFGGDVIVTLSTGGYGAIAVPSINAAGASMTLAGSGILAAGVSRLPSDLSNFQQTMNSKQWNGDADKTSRTIGTVEGKVNGRKANIRVDFEKVSNKIQIQSGGGKNSGMDERIIIDKISDRASIYRQLSSPVKNAVSKANLEKIVDYVWKAYKIYRG